MQLNRCLSISLCNLDVFVVMLALHSEYGKVRNTIVLISESMTRRKALAKLTLMRSMVNLSSPRSSVFDTILGIYLLTAEAEWKGADDAEDIMR